MSIIAINAQNMQLALQNDAQQLRTMISWLVQRNVSYSQNMTTANMTAAGISTADQTAILAFVADISRLVTFVNGTLPGVAANISVDITGVLGVL